MNDLSQNNTFLKSNTSLVSIVCKDSVILGSDRRVTAGNLVVDKTFKKIMFVNDYTLVAFTGGVSDAQLTNKVLAAELRLKELKTKIRPNVKEAANLLAMLTYRSIRNPSMIPSIVGTLIAGWDENNEPAIFTIEPAGAIVKVKDYDANFSSGMPYILGLLERQWKPELSTKEGVELAVEALKSSTQRDTGSGNGIDVFTIAKDGIKHVVSQKIIPTYN